MILGRVEPALGRWIYKNFGTCPWIGPLFSRKCPFPRGFFTLHQCVSMPTRPSSSQPMFSFIHSIIGNNRLVHTFLRLAVCGRKKFTSIFVVIHLPTILHPCQHRVHPTQPKFSFILATPRPIGCSSFIFSGIKTSGSSEAGRRRK